MAQDGPQAQPYLVQCSPDTFEHASWLSAVHSQVISVNEREHSLRIFPLSEALRGQFEKLGACVTRPGCF